MNARGVGTARAALAPLGLLLAAGAAAAPPLEEPAPFELTDTSRVQALAADAATLWVGTSGGLEAYDLTTLARRRLYRTSDGLLDNDVRAVEAGGSGLRVVSVAAACQLDGERFRCARVERVLTTVVAPAAVFRGERVTVTLTVGPRRFVGTARAGLWLDGAPPRRLTPTAAACGNHVVALERFVGRLWVASFDEGLCSFDGRTLRRASLVPRLINDLVTVPGALYVATGDGLFRTRDGERFSPLPLEGRAVVDLAYAEGTLWAVTAGALWEIPLGPGRLRRHAEPGGARALQAVDVRAGHVWLASEDRGALRRLPGGGFQIFDRAAGLPASWTIDVAATPDGGAYVATLRDGLVRVDPDGAVRAVAGPLDPWLLHARYEGETGALFVGTQNGAARLDVTGAGALTPLPRPPHPSVHVLFPARDGLWMGTEGGLVRLPAPSPSPLIGDRHRVP